MWKGVLVDVYTQFDLYSVDKAKDQRQKKVSLAFPVSAKSRPIFVAYCVSILQILRGSPFFTSRALYTPVCNARHFSANEMQSQETQ
jgi:hypothetical protein